MNKPLNLNVDIDIKKVQTKKCAFNTSFNQMQSLENDWAKSSSVFTTSV